MNPFDLIALKTEKEDTMARPVKWDSDPLVNEEARPLAAECACPGCGNLVRCEEMISYCPTCNLELVSEYDFNPDEDCDIVDGELDDSEADSIIRSLFEDEISDSEILKVERELEELTPSKETKKTKNKTKTNKKKPSKKKTQKDIKTNVDDAIGQIIETTKKEDDITDIIKLIKDQPPDIEEEEVEIKPRDKK